MNSWHVRAYSALLRLYPRRFQAEYRREMTLLFAQQLEDARATEGNIGIVRLWARSLLDLAATAPTEHLENDVLVAQPVGGFDQSRTKPDRVERITWMIAALAPAFTVLLLFAFAPNFLSPMLAMPPETFGIPTGSVIIVVCMIWNAVGVAVVERASRRRHRLVAIVLFVVPATCAIIFGPALILILLNLTP